MRLTTLCYLEQDGKYLMLHRIVKKKDVNKDKWIGIGGKFEPGESPEDCVLREAREETGFLLTSYRLRGIVTFLFNDQEAEYMFLYTADGFTGQPVSCDEGTLEWVPKEEIDRLNLWEGDRIFFRLMDEGEPFFSLKLHYYGNRLSEAVLNGVPMELLDVLDEGGDPSGLVRERSMVHERGDYHRTSHVWVVRESQTAAMRCCSRSAAAGRIPLRAATIFPAPAIFRRETDTSSQPDGSLRRSWGSPLRRKNWNLPVFLRASMRGTFTESPLSTAKRLRSTFTEGRWRRNAWSSRPMRWNLSGGWIWRRPARQQKHRRTASVYRKESCCS